jgi:AP-2 complex subunit sigma-1
VYRRYAGLFFCVCVDANDNELAYLEAIHLFVEVLGKSPIVDHRSLVFLISIVAADSFFDNVCELDLVFNFYKVRLTLSSIYSSAHFL